MNGRKRTGALALGTLAAVPLASAESAHALLPAEGGGPAATEPSSPAAPPAADPPAPVPPRSIRAVEHEAEQKAEPPAPGRSIRVAERQAERNSTPPAAGPPPAPPRSIRTVERAAERKAKRRAIDVEAPAVGVQTRPPGVPAGADAAERYLRMKQGLPPTPPSYADDRREPLPSVTEPEEDEASEEEDTPAPVYGPREMMADTFDNVGDSDEEDEAEPPEPAEVDEPEEPAPVYGPREMMADTFDNVADDDTDLSDVWNGAREQGAGFLEGAGESIAGTKDSLVSTYESIGMQVCMPVPPPRRGPCTNLTLPGVSDQEQEEASDERIRVFEFAIDNPGEFGKQVINWDDLSHGRIGEWLGGLAPDVAASALTAGTGGPISRLLRLSGGRGPDADAPDLDAPSVPPTPVEKVRDRLDKLDDGDDTTEGLEDLMRRTGAGAERNGPRRPGENLYSETRGGSTELRTLTLLNDDPDVAGIEIVPRGNDGQSADFVVTYQNGVRERVEVTSVTRGTPSGYQPRGAGRGAPLRASDIRRGITRKTGDRNQFLAPMDGIGPGGKFVIQVRGPAPTTAILDRVFSRSATRGLTRAQVREVVLIVEGKPTRYVRRGTAYTRVP